MTAAQIRKNTIVSQKGEVRGVRELSRGVQAEVCLGTSTQHGYAAIVVESSSPAVRKALAALKRVLRDEAYELTSKIIEDQREWDRASG